MRLIHVFVRSLCQWKWIWVSTSITVASFTGIGVCSRTITPPAPPARTFTPPTEKLIRVSDLPPSMETIGGDNGPRDIPYLRDRPGNLDDRQWIYPRRPLVVSDVTEPATAAMVVLGVVGLLAVRRTQ